MNFKALDIKNYAKQRSVTQTATTKEICGSMIEEIQ